MAGKENKELPPSLLIELSSPIKFGDKSYDAIELREPKAGEVMKAQNDLQSTSDTLKYGIALTSIVSGVPRNAIEQLPISKLMQAINYLMGFFDVGQEIGKS